MSICASACLPLRTCAAVLVLALSTGATARSAIVVGPGGDLQAAINGATGGDVITLTAGVTYTGNFLLPTHGGSGVVTIRTKPDDRLPAPGQRVSPQDAPRLARLQSGNSGPALQTAPGARGWRLELLEFGPKPGVVAHFRAAQFYDMLRGRMGSKDLREKYMALTRAEMEKAVAALKPQERYYADARIRLVDYLAGEGKGEQAEKLCREAIDQKTAQEIYLRRRLAMLTGAPASSSAAAMARVEPPAPNTGRDTAGWVERRSAGTD